MSATSGAALAQDGNHRPAVEPKGVRCRQTAVELDKSRCDRAGMGLVLRCLDQLRQGLRLDERVVVQDPDVLGAGVECMPDADVVATRIAEVCAGLDDRIVSACAAEKLFRPVA